MNYFLIVVILLVCGGAYYTHQQDQQQIAALQAKLAGAPGNSESPSPSPTSPDSEPTTTAAATPPTPAPAPLVPVVPPKDGSRAPAIDAAAQAALAAQKSDGLGSISTLNGRTLLNCKVLKVEADGVTFSHSEGITKVLFPLLPPDLQKKFGYDPQQAVRQTAAEASYQQQVSAVTNAAAAP